MRWLHLFCGKWEMMRNVLKGSLWVRKREQALPLTFRVYRGGHPSPNEASVAAAADVLKTLGSLAEKDLVVFLISGGGSAMLEQFLQPELSLETIAATHKALVESGAPIAAMNAVRKHLSAVKGGRLAAAAAPAEQVTLFVSDVPPGELDALSSGPTLPDRSTVDDVFRIVEEYGLMERFPAVDHEDAAVPCAGRDAEAGGCGLCAVALECAAG